MELAIEYYTQAGYSVTDVSGHQPFDLACVISGVNHHVEVKGTTGDGEKILLTPNEVEHARNYSPVALFIVNAISLSHSLGDDCRAAGGSLICRQPWDISKGELVAVGYSYEPEPCY